MRSANSSWRNVSRLTAHNLALVCGLGLSACTGTLEGSGGSGGPGDDPGSSGAAGTGNGSGSGGSSGTGASTGGGASGSTGTGGSIGGGPGGYDIALDGAPIHSHFVRLTHQQWENSVRDLLKLAAAPGLSTAFTSDPPEGTFSNNERALYVTAGLRGDYERAAEDVAKRVSGNAQALAAVAGGTNAATFVRTFGRRAYRRPLEAGEQQRYEALFASAATLYTTGDAFANGVELVIRAMLQSPHFLYRSELGADDAPLSSFEVASKLSFLLRDTTPDDALLDAAEHGELATADGVAARAQTLVDSPAAVPVLARYHRELFGIGRFESIDKDRTAFPNYTQSMNQELMEADRMFFDAVFQNGRGLRQILTSSVAFVSAQTAPLYGVSATGSGLTQVDLGPDRPGFYTRLGFLAYNANLRDTDPIHRGVDISHRLLCSKLAPPPDIVIEPLPASVPGETTRERVTAHTGLGTCGQGCHSTIINPLGFAFENFDAVGQLRAVDNGNPVDTADSYEFATGIRSYSGAPELMAILADSPEAQSCYARNLTEYTLARDVDETDRPLVNELSQTSLGAAGSVKAMLLAVIRSPRFSTRNGGAL